MTASMQKISTFLARSIGVWLILLGLGSFLIASRYSDVQARAFRETLLSRHPEMDLRDVMALTDTFGGANERIIWIMACTSILWFCLAGVLAYALGKTTRI